MFTPSKRKLLKVFLAYTGLQQGNQQFSKTGLEL
jgi:hypothetical protein